MTPQQKDKLIAWLESIGYGGFIFMDPHGKFRVSTSKGCPGLDCADYPSLSALADALPDVPEPCIATRKSINLFCSYLKEQGMVLDKERLGVLAKRLEANATSEAPPLTTREPCIPVSKVKEFMKEARRRTHNRSDNWSGATMHELEEIIDSYTP